MTSISLLIFILSLAPFSFPPLALFFSSHSLMEMLVSRLDVLLVF